MLSSNNCCKGNVLHCSYAVWDISVKGICYMKKGQEYEYGNDNAEEEIKYYAMLNDFASVVTKANKQSFQGMTPKHIANTLRRSAEAFCNLCMIDAIIGSNGPDAAQEKVQEQATVHKEEAAAPEQEAGWEPQQKEQPIPDNFLRIDKSGWGLCPVCGTKVLKVTATTRLENFPVYCKRCKADHLVNWWNAENQKILYKRYVNDRHLREQALKGTGLASFRNTGSSATERVAVRRS